MHGGIRHARQFASHKFAGVLLFIHLQKNPQVSPREVQHRIDATELFGGVVDATVGDVGLSVKLQPNRGQIPHHLVFFLLPLLGPFLGVVDPHVGVEMTRL
jgi:hypothetical protein